jgi:hypothetical protein
LLTSMGPPTGYLVGMEVVVERADLANDLDGITYTYIQSFSGALRILYRRVCIGERPI